MIEVNVVNLRTIGERKCLSLPKEEPKDLDMATNRAINDLTIFQLQLDNFKLSLKDDGLKSKNTVINLLLETLIKYKDEIRSIDSNHDIGNIQLEKT